MTQINEKQTTKPKYGWGWINGEDDFEGKDWISIGILDYPEDDDFGKEKGYLGDEITRIQFGKSQEGLTEKTIRDSEQEAQHIVDALNGNPPLVFVSLSDGGASVTSSAPIDLYFDDAEVPDDWEGPRVQKAEVEVRDPATVQKLIDAQDDEPDLDPVSCPKCGYDDTKQCFIDEGEDRGVPVCPNCGFEGDNTVVYPHKLSEGAWEELFE
jgi:hypothetical protein